MRMSISKKTDIFIGTFRVFIEVSKISDYYYDEIENFRLLLSISFDIYELILIICL